MKENRGGAGRGQGRKKTGRVRTETLSLKFTKDEKKEVIETMAKSDLTQSDFILKKCLDKGKNSNG